MKQISYFQQGMIIYAIILNKVQKLRIEEVYVDVKQEPYVKYKLEILESGLMTHLDSTQVFESLDLLKDNILKQFDKLTPKEVGECKKEEEKESTVS